MKELQQTNGASRMQRTCAVLCLFLLLFSVAHTVFGHADALTTPGMENTGTAASHMFQPVTTDTPDTCVLCVAITTVVVLTVLAMAAPQPSRSRPPMVLLLSGPVSGWVPCLFSRPPPAV